MRIRPLSSLRFIPAGISTMLSLVAGHHRACPSATLDKSILLFGFSYLSTYRFSCQYFFYIGYHTKIIHNIRAQKDRKVNKTFIISYK